MSWMETLQQRLERERKLREQYPEFDIAGSPDRVLQVDNHRMQSGGPISTFSQMAMQLARHAAEQVRASNEGPPGLAPSEVGTMGQPQKRAGVPRGVAEAFPEEAQGRPTYRSGAQGPSSSVINPLHTGSLLDNQTGLPGPIRGALNNPIAGPILREAARPSNWITAATAPAAAAATRGIPLVGGVAGALIDLPGNPATRIGTQIGAVAGGQIAHNLTPQDAPGAVKVGAEFAGSVGGAVAGGGIGGAVSRFGPDALHGAGSLATGYRDLTKNIPVGASLRDFSQVPGFVRPTGRVPVLKTQKEMSQTLDALSEAGPLDVTKAESIVRWAEQNNAVASIGWNAQRRLEDTPRNANLRYIAGHLFGVLGDEETQAQNLYQLPGVQEAARGVSSAGATRANNIPVGAGIKDISGSGDILNDAERISQINAVEEQVRHEGGWTADTIKQWQEVTGKRPTASMLRSEESIAPPGTVGARTAEDITQGAGNAIAKNAGATDTNLRNDLPLLHVLDAVENLKGLQGARKESVGALRSRQAGALRGTLENVQGQGMEGLAKVSAARYGAADVPTYTPLKELIPQETIDNVANHLMERGLDKSPFAVGTARDAWVNMVEGRWVTPSQLKAFSDVAGLDAEQAAKIQARLTKVGGIDKANPWDQIIKNPIRAVNNTIRAAHLWTLVDMTFMGRLAPTAAIYDLGSYTKATGQAFRSLKNPGVVDDVLKSLDERAAVSGYLPDTQLMHEVGLRFHSSELNDQSPGLLGKLPLLGRGAKLDQVMTGLLRPQMMHSTVENMVKAGKLTEEQARDPDILEQIARGVNNIGGASNIIKAGGDAELISSFPNWYASQFELIASAFQRGSISHDMARQTLAKLTLIMTAATVGGTLAQGKNPADYIKDGVPQLPIGNDGLTVDLYGPIGELIRHAVRTGRAGYEGATPDGPGGRIDIAGGAGAAGHELAGWGRSMLSPLLGIATDLMLGKDYTGTKIRDTQEHTLEYLGRTTVPFTASSFLGLGEKGNDFLSLSDRGVLANTLSEFGARGVHVPSEGQRLYGPLDDLAKGMNLTDGTGKKIDSFGDLPPGAKDQIRQEHPELADKIDAYQVKQGEETGTAVQVKRELQSRQAADDKLLEQNPIGYASQWRNNTNDRQTELALRKDEIYRGVDFKKGQWPVLDAYFNEIKQATGENGVVDWEAVDAWRSKLNETDDKFIDDNTGLSSLSPTVRQYRADRKTIDDSGYWDVRDQAFKVFADAVGAKSGESADDYFAGLSKEYLTMAQQYLDSSSPGWRTSSPGSDQMMAQAISQKVVAKFNEVLGAYHKQFLYQHSDIYALLTKWGYRQPSLGQTALYAGGGQ